MGHRTGTGRLKTPNACPVKIVRRFDVVVRIWTQNSFVIDGADKAFKRFQPVFISLVYTGGFQHLGKHFSDFGLQDPHQSRIQQVPAGNIV